ncbi:hypothetical protein [Streptomyces sp. A1547]|uniref:hypothetical protein n=1 Tax=Streptomyces sp. A1547 TaxID=2563105 RepID=UPI00109EB903|nr:hypothetical protein [Streptomyces sp. A1547]THA39090.1 hypothetical protein E6W17_12925 [Streptomyces sp. A1547]
MTALGSGSTPCGCGGGSAPDLPTGPGHGGGPCDPGPCGGDELPVNPFLALRVAFGMLLGEDDFRVLMGNPRGKLMLHNAWLHGPGVVRGLGIARDGDELRVLPGLAVDGLGRELTLEAAWCVSLTAWARDWIEAKPPQDDHPPRGTPADAEPDPPRRRTVEAWILAEFASCPDRPVPALADPCDVTRRHDDFSRIVETARITIRSTAPAPWRPYHRVRVLLGLDEAAPGDTAGREALREAAEVARVPAHLRAPALLAAFRRLAAADATALEPERAEGDMCPPWAPVTEDHAPVVLARLTVELTEYDGCVRVEQVRADPSARTAVLPTTTVQELVCGLAPGIIGAAAEADAGGPRLIRGSLAWSREYTVLSFEVTAPLAQGSAEPEGIEITSLSDAGRGWATDEVAGIRVSADGRRVKVDLDQRPAYETVRIRVRGTGPKPLYGVHPRAPFAGLEGGPPGTADEGNDAVVTVHLPRQAAPGRTEE